jgi:uncharacterized protein YggT (Ycf19 family)
VCAYLPALDLIDFILNVAAVLLWLNWRSMRLDPLADATPATLAGTIRRVEQPRLKRWHQLLIIVALIILRAAFYVQIGPTLGWTPKLDLVAVSLPFPLVVRGQNFFLSALLFSAVSFLRVLLVFYFWLLALVVINGRKTAAGPLLRWISLQLGPIVRWPVWLQILLPLLTGAAAWLVANPLLVRIGVIDPAQSPRSLAGQALVVGASLYLSLKYLLPALLLLHLVSSYVFLGNNPFWEFIGSTARRMVAPLNRVPLRLGRVDFAPLITLITILFVLNAVPITRWVCREYFPKSTLQQELNRWVLWPR